MLATPRRAVLLGLVVAVASLGATGVAGADPGARATAKKPPKAVVTPVNPAQPCGYLTTAQVQKAFGGPVTIDPTDRGNKVPNACAFVVGPNALAPVGLLVTTNQFPGFLVPPGEDAVAVVEAQRAIDSEDGYSTVDANLGTTSYVNSNLSTLYVAPNHQFAFELQWLPSSQPSTGGPLSAKDHKSLVALATLIVARAPKP